MESFDTLYLVVGAVAVAVGIYMLITKKLIGRKEGVPKKLEAKFVKLDAATYIAEGLLSASLGLGSIVPFLNNLIVQFIIIALGVCVVAVNYFIGKKIKSK